MSFDPRMPYPPEGDDSDPVTLGWLRQFLQRFYEYHREITTRIDPVQQTYLSATDTLLGRQTTNGGPGEEIPCSAFGRSLIANTTAAGARSTLVLGAADAVVFGAVTAGTTGGITSGTATLNAAAFSTWTGGGDTAAGFLIVRDTITGGVFCALVDAGVTTSAIISDPTSITGAGKWGITFPGGLAFRLVNGFAISHGHKSTFISTAGVTTFS